MVDSANPDLQATPAAAVPPSPWLTVTAAARYAAVSTDLIYLAVERDELRHVRVAGRRSIRLRVEWVDAWLEQFGRGGKAKAQ